MPGTEDYTYEGEQPNTDDFHAVVEVTQADSNPAFYPPEQKSEAVLSEDEKKELAEADNTERERGGGDVKTGDGETVVTSEEVDAAMSEGEERPPAKKSVPKSTSK